MQEKIVRARELVRATFSFFFPFLFPIFLLILAFFFKVQGTRSLVSMLERSRRTQIYELVIFFKELLETMSEVYLQGKHTAKMQAVCLELRSPLLHFRVSPPHPASPHAGVNICAYTGAVL